MNNTVWSWENFINIHSATLSKIAVLCMFVFVLFNMYKKRIKRKSQSKEGPIAEANARERHQWRYFWWLVEFSRYVIGAYFIVWVVKFLLA